MKYACKNCRYLCYGRYCNRTYKEDKYYYGWVSLAEYRCNGKCKFYKEITFGYRIKKLLDKIIEKMYNPKILNIFKRKNTKKMIIVKTEMKSMPTSCQDCYYHLVSYSLGEKLIGCPVIKNWLTQEEIKEGKEKFPNCPLEEDNKK